MIGMIVVKKFSEMKKEIERLNYPKTLNFSYVDKDLELVTRQDRQQGGDVGSLAWGPPHS